MLTCRQCQSDKIRRSRTRNTWEWVRKEITHKRPYRCHACGWRGWERDVGPTFGDAELKVATRAVATAPPDLGDAHLMPESRPTEVNLDELDFLKPLGPTRN